MNGFFRFVLLGALIGVCWSSSFDVGPVEFGTFAPRNEIAPRNERASGRLMAQERQSLFFWGDSSYSAPRSFGFFGYSRPQYSAPVVPASVQDESLNENATAGKFDNESNEYLNGYSQTKPGDAGNRLAIPKTSAFATGDSQTISDGGGLSSDGLSSDGSPLNGLSPRLPESPLDATDDSSIVADSVVPPTGLKSSQELFSFLNRRPETTATVEPDGLSSFRLTAIRAPRNSFFQRFNVDLAYLPNTRTENSGIVDLDLAATFAAPCPTFDSPLLMTPFFSWTQFDLPEAVSPTLGKQLRLYSPGLKAEYLFPVGDSLLIDLAANVQWSSDLKANDSRALRVTGYGTGIWKLDEETRLILGASYCDVGDLKVWPIAGLIWKPSDVFYVDAYFPRPKIARRLDAFPCLDRCLKTENQTASEHWLYLAGEFDGDVWIFQSEQRRINENGSFGSTCLLKYYDVRCFAGLERKTLDRLDWALEGGVSLTRNLKISSRDFVPGFYQEFEPKATGFARLKILY